MIRAYSIAELSVEPITIDQARYETIGGCNACVERYGTVQKLAVHKEIDPLECLPGVMGETHENMRPGTPIHSALRRRCRSRPRRCSERAAANYGDLEWLAHPGVLR